MNDKSEGGEPRSEEATDDPSIGHAIRGWLRGLWKAKNGDSTVRDTLEGLIEERVEAEVPFDQDELALLANIFELRGRTVQDVMVPRFEIVAIERNTTLSGVVEAIMREGHSRLPVFSETLDNAVGMVHIKDVIAWRGRDDDFKLNDIGHELLFVAPSMQVLELLLEMRVKRCHMALVVDEYGGIDGLVTIEDLVEEIVGEIEDEHDAEDVPEFSWRSDGGLDADARASIDSFEAMFGPVATIEEHEEIKSLGGLVFSLVGRVPIRGEIIAHPAGVEFEVLDADPRRVKRLRIRRSRAATVANAPA
jgi:magnesium and cobalt transporter